MSLQPVAIEILTSPPPGSMADSHRYYMREKGTESWLPLGSTDSLRVTFDSLPRTGLWEIAVAPVVAGIEADPEAWTIVDWKPDASDFTAPADVSAFRVAQSGDSILFAWSPVDVVNLSHYEIRIGQSWDNGILVAKVPASLTAWTSGVWYTGTQLYWIAAWTDQGLTGANPASAAVDVEGSDYEPVQATNDESGGGFAATKTDTEVNSSKLRITQVPATSAAWTTACEDALSDCYMPTIGSGTYDTGWTDCGAVVRERIEVSLSAAADTRSIACSEWSMPIEDIGQYLTPTGYDTRGMSVVVWIDTAQDATPTPDGWRRWVPGATYKYRQVRIRLALETIGLRNILVTTLAWRRRRLNRKDEQSVTVSGTGGTAVTWTTSFTAAPKVSATVITTASRHVSVSDVTVSGCNVRVWDAAGTEQSSGAVHVLAMGV